MKVDLMEQQLLTSFPTIFVNYSDLFEGSVGNQGAME